MRWQHAIPLVVLAAGCFSVPPFEPEDAVKYTESGAGGATIAGKGFALRFADGDGFHFPDALMIGDTNVIGHDPAQECFRADELGVLIAPTARISAHTSAEPVTNRLLSTLPGPAIAQAKVEWATGFPCDGTRTPRGTSTFTVFPDGRIVRHDTIADPSTSSISPVPCACEPPTQSEDQLFRIRTYWTLARDRFTEYNLPGEDPKLLPTPSERIGNQATACFNGGTYQVAFAWSDFVNNNIRGGDAVIGFDHELGPVGPSMLESFAYEDISTVFVGSAGCEAELERADKQLMPQVLRINGTVTMVSARDGIYGGADTTGAAGIDLPSGTAELEGPVDSSFAVWLRFPRSADAVRASLPNKSGAWYIPQRVDDRTWIFWFRDGISMAQKIKIEPI